MEYKAMSWEQIIQEYSEQESKFKSRTCCIYNNQPRSSDNDSDKLCPCGRMVSRHSFTDDSLEHQSIEKTKTRFQQPTEFRDLSHSKNVPLNVFGTMKPNGCKFLRIDNRLKVEHLYKLILKDCQGKRPNVILSIFGGAKFFTMTERLEKEFIAGVIDAATMASK